MQVGQGCQQHLFVLRPELRQEFPVSEEEGPGIPHSGTSQVLGAVQTQQSVVQVGIPVEPKPQSAVLFKDTLVVQLKKSEIENKTFECGTISQAFMLDKTRKPLFPQLGTKKNIFLNNNSDFFFWEMSHWAEK